MADFHENGGDYCSSDFSDKADNLEKQMNAITIRLEDLEKIIEDKTNSVAKLESTYSPEELGKTEEELESREVHLFSLWQELKGIQYLLGTKDKTLREIYNDIRRLNSEMVSHGRKDRSTELEFGQQIEKTQKQMEKEAELDDDTDWEREFSSEFSLSLILRKDFRLQSPRNQRTLHEIKSRKDKLNRADAVKSRSEALARRADTLKRSIDKEILAIGREFRRRKKQIATDEVLSKTDAAMAASAVLMLVTNKSATQVGKQETEKLEDQLKRSRT